MLIVTIIHAIIRVYISDLKEAALQFFPQVRFRLLLQGIAENLINTIPVIRNYPSILGLCTRTH